MIAIMFWRNYSATSALLLQLDLRCLACKSEDIGRMHTFSAFADITSASPAQPSKEAEIDVPLAQMGNARKGKKTVLNWIVWLGQFLKVITKIEDSG